MTKKQILLINDLAGYGKVATAAMLPILSYMGLPVYNLPTALVSNTLDYGKFNIMETTDYMKGVFPVWKQLGFSFDALPRASFAVSDRHKWWQPIVANRQHRAPQSLLTQSWAMRGNCITE